MTTTIDELSSKYVYLDIFVGLFMQVCKRIYTIYLS